jgi:hypothetical protein
MKNLVGTVAMVRAAPAFLKQPFFIQICTKRTYKPPTTAIDRLRGHNRSSISSLLIRHAPQNSLDPHPAVF